MSKNHSFSIFNQNTVSWLHRFPLAISSVKMARMIIFPVFSWILIFGLFYNFNAFIFYFFLWFPFAIQPIRTIVRKRGRKLVVFFILILYYSSIMALPLIQKKDFFENKCNLYISDFNHLGRILPANDIVERIIITDLDLVPENSRLLLDFEAFNKDTKMPELFPYIQNDLKISQSNKFLFSDKKTVCLFYFGSTHPAEDSSPKRRASEIVLANGQNQFFNLFHKPEPRD